MRIPSIVCALLALLPLSACQRRPAAPAEPGLRILRISQRNEPDDLDPAVAALPDDFFIIRALSEGLILPARRGGSPTPAAADRWTVSPDGLVWKFRLAPGGRWSNGEPVTAEDFIASYRRVLDPSTAAPHADLFFAVVGARAFASGQLTDFARVGFAAPLPGELVVTLERPTPGFLDYVASGPWIPTDPRVVARFGRQWTRPENYVGNGPFVLTEWRPNQRIAVSKNPRYRDAGAIQIDRIQFLRFDDDNAEERAYRAGEVDVTMKVPASKLELYARDRPAELHHASLAETRYLAFNLRRPPLDDRRVRQALALAIDRERLVADVVRGGQEPAYRMVPPELRPADDTAAQLRSGPNAIGPPNSGADAEARRLLAAAGFPGGAHWPALELAGWSGSPVLEAIQAMWKKTLGIEVSLVNREARSHLAAVRAGRYDIAFMPLIPPVADPLPTLSAFVTGAADNYPHWSDPAFDRWVEAATRAPDAEQRGPLLQAAETRLLDECPVTPLYFNARNWAMRTSVHGWREDALWTRYYPSLWLDPP
jgi:oligopeptide transport system substrate-binding protein